MSTLRTVIAVYFITLIVVLSIFVLGCAERPDLAPVEVGHQHIEKIVPAVPYPPPVVDGQAPSEQNEQEKPEKPHKPSRSLASTKPDTAKRQAQKPSGSTYTVMPGDTLSGIALKTGRDLQDLAKRNNIKPPSYQVEVGQVLKLSGAVKVERVKAQQKSSAADLTAQKSMKPKLEPDKRLSKNTNTTKQKSIAKKRAKLNFGWPLTGKIQKDFLQTGKKGINIAAKTGQKVQASESGKVVYSGQGLIGYGNLLIIKHSDEYLTAYANNSALLVKEGDVVQKGQDIAKVGLNTSHKGMLHFEIREHGKSVNPLNFLPSYE